MYVRGEVKRISENLFIVQIREKAAICFGVTDVGRNNAIIKYVNSEMMQ